MILRRGDDYDGRVVVKTNANSGGKKVKERRRFRRAATKIFAFFRGAAVKPIPLTANQDWRKCKWLDSGNYPVFDSIAAVPPLVWTNPHLIVEKFLPERDADGNYRLRLWYFLGEEEACQLVTGAFPIVKAKGILKRELIDEVPDEIRQLRRDLGFDYGKFDFAISNGRVVLYDVNRTPTLSTGARELLSRGRLAELASGLGAFCP
jgi:hypothetical protein